MKRYVFVLLLIAHLSWLSLSTIPAQGQEIPDLGSRLELFVDSFLLDRMEGTTLMLHHPVDEGRVMPFDKPWEGAFSAYVTIIKDGSLYRMYYRGLPKNKKDGSKYETTNYAESRDGIHWTRPTVGIYKIEGTYNNNVVLADAKPITHNFSPFLDTSQNVLPEQRFKALGGLAETGLFAYVSADGIHWKKLQEEPVITTKGMVFKKNPFDSQNVSFWSEYEQKYLCYFRSWTAENDTNYRTISRTTSTDYIHWTKPVEMDLGNTPRENLYTNQTAPYFRAPHIYIALAARFMSHRQILKKKQARHLDINRHFFKDCSDAVLLSSRGGNRYYRTFLEGFIRPGIGLDNWVSRSNYPAHNVVQTGPAEMSLYLNQDYAQPTAHLHRYSLRLDGFVSVNAPYHGGEMITKPFRFAGDTLFINFSTSAAGYVMVEIQDADGHPYPGYSAADAREIIGNEIAKAVRWAQGASVASLQGKTVRLRFIMKDADLYSIRFK